MQTIISDNDAVFLKISDNHGSWLGILPPGSKWIIVGRVNLTFVMGDLAILFGNVIRPNPNSPLTVYSPSSHALVDLRVPSQTSCDRGFSLSHLKEPFVKASCGSESNWDFVEKNLTPHTKSLFSSSVCIIFQPFLCRVCDSIEHTRRFKGIFSPKGNIVGEDRTLIRGDSFCLLSAAAGEGFINNPEMEQVYQKISSFQGNFLHSFLSNSTEGQRKVKTLLCGPGNTGKSTFMRYLVNRLLSCDDIDAVGVLDCDVGQSEFTPAGMISFTLIRRPIYGPPFTHPFHRTHVPER